MDKNRVRLFSKQIGDEFVISLSMPEGYDKTQPYPALYLLDAQWAFPKAVRAVRNLQASRKISPFLLIGIGYPEQYRENDYIRHRARDFTFPADRSGDPEYELSGQADRFTAFLHKELIPMIEDQYPIDPHNRTLFGHSLSAYYALYNLLHFPDTPFQNFIAASGSFWWADHAIFDRFEGRGPAREEPTRLLLTAGAQEATEQIVESEEVLRRLRKCQPGGLETRFRIYKGAGHRASAIASLVDGGRWFYGKG